MVEMTCSSLNWASELVRSVIQVTLVVGGMSVSENADLLTISKAHREWSKKKKNVNSEFSEQQFSE